MRARAFDPPRHPARPWLHLAFFPSFQLTPPLRDTTGGCQGGSAQPKLRACAVTPALLSAPPCACPSDQRRRRQRGSQRRQGSQAGTATRRRRGRGRWRGHLDGSGLRRVDSGRWGGGSGGGAAGERARPARLRGLYACLRIIVVVVPLLALEAPLAAVGARLALLAIGDGALCGRQEGGTFV